MHSSTLQSPSSSSNAPLFVTLRSPPNAPPSVTLSPHNAPPSGTLRSPPSSSNAPPFGTLMSPSNAPPSSTTPCNAPFSGTLKSPPSSSNATPSDTLHSLESPPLISQPEDLYSMFSNLSVDQVDVIVGLSNNNLDARECMLTGPTLDSILTLCKAASSSWSISKLHVDTNDLWEDILAHYKCATTFNFRLRIILDNQPAIDTGGVRRQVLQLFFDHLMENRYDQIFQGGENHLNPFYSSKVRGSNLFRIIGRVIGHSIYYDGIGFPHFSLMSYWYVAAGEEVASNYITVNDVNQDIKELIQKV